MKIMLGSWIERRGAGRGGAAPLLSKIKVENVKKKNINILENMIVRW